MLLSELPKRSSSVLEKRFGLGKSGKRLTLEAIGKTYNITRERVRQIERDGILRIKKAPSYNKLDGVFSAFNHAIQEQGGVMAESSLISHFDTANTFSNHIRFLLTLAPGLQYRSEDSGFDHRWAVDVSFLINIEKALQNTFDYIKKDDHVLSREEITGILSDNVKTVTGSAPSEAALASYLAVSRKIDVNCFGQWGHAESSLIRPRGVRDMAYLVFQKEQRPLHFLEAATLIRDLITKKQVHAQTVHNELIKDSRFVLVGRGTYGLAEWGYEPGTVRDIITRALKVGPLTKEDIIEQVLGKRQVKSNTILINLQNKRFFKKLPDGTYTSMI